MEFYLVFNMALFVNVLNKDVMQIIVDEGRLPRANRDTYSLENKRRGIVMICIYDFMVSVLKPSTNLNYDNIQTT